MSDSDLHWLRARRPEPPLNPAATRAARNALLAEIEGAGRARRRASLAVAAALAAAATAAVLAIGTGNHGHALAVDNAAAAPLTRLAAQVIKSAAPAGDATLIVRTQSYPDRPSNTGYDLYLDGGTYFYADTEVGLPDAIAQGGSDGQDDRWAGRDVAAARAALTLPLDQARQRMATAALDPNAKPPSAAERLAANTALLAKVAAVNAERAKNGLGPITLHRPDPVTHMNGEIWSNSLDALIAGAGRPDVRSGVLTLLGSIPEVTTQTTSLDGESVLELTANVFPDSYQERLYIDAQTGIPVKFVGGTDGHDPSVVVTYKVSRVRAGKLAGS
jgi:hypothetical protein